MDAHTALRTRTTTHHFRPDPVPREAVIRALEAGMAAPNHRRTWPWRFLLLGRASRAPLADLAVELKRGPDGMLPGDAAVARIRDKILTPPWCVVVTCTRSDDAFRQNEDRAAVACAIQNIQLSLHADGIASKWSTGAVTRRPETYAHLDLDPDEVEVTAFLWVGLPAESARKPERPPLAEVLTERP